jgi:2-keto-4-pentenoate hydratase/2-oxohepta-3-ene-1,7-dioic acid hydratase in catechol pathway
VLDAGRVLDLRGAAGETLPGDMAALIAAGPAALERVRALAADPPPAAVLPRAGLALCAPIPRPARNVFCVGRNYLDHVAEGDRVRQVATEVPEWPQFFTKPPQAVIGPGDADPVACRADGAARLRGGTRGGDRSRGPRHPRGRGDDACLRRDHRQ